MATAIAIGCTAVSPAPVPCEVLSASGRWVGGYELLSIRDDGLLTIRSTRTGAIRHLPVDRWQDPMEEALLEVAAGPGLIRRQLGAARPRRTAQRPGQRRVHPLQLPLTLRQTAL